MPSVTRAVIFNISEMSIIVLSLSRASLGTVMAERVYHNLSSASYGRLKGLWHENLKSHRPASVNVPGQFTFSRIKERKTDDQS